MIAAATTAASPKPPRWDAWDKSFVLPYDRPLEMKMAFLDAGQTQFVLSQYRGSPVVLNIFATWCDPCNQEQPAFVKAATRYAPAAVQFIGIDDGDSDDAVRAYRREYGIPYPIAMDRRKEVTRALEVGRTLETSVVPTTLFIRPDGYLYGVLRDSMEADELAYRIEKFLSDVNR
ncbi:MAG: TlpA family protein disulfide reductase [Candidatus Eremiobacteraeota bacterium]|nr:TlpA family protein disulfide reductase [Candidatus Eremiobacteraeota bacterium]